MHMGYKSVNKMSHFVTVFMNVENCKQDILPAFLQREDVIFERVGKISLNIVSHNTDFRTSRPWHALVNVAGCQHYA